MPLSKTGAELLFEVFSRRYERSATLVTSNLPFNEWTEAFGSERLTGARAGPAHPPRSHPGDERRELPAQGQQEEAPRHVSFLAARAHIRRRIFEGGLRYGLHAPRKAGRRPTLQPPP